ncbi:MAG: hypothetical protein AMJ62_09895 [Myxococcales bacterium SG8_38]|nr:MAG: hypothetical protein AMJ62_09895 [Myxococcales bacterium SG8_38]
MGWTTKIMVLCSAVVMWTAACKVDSDDVQEWKGTVKGPARLTAVIRSDRYSPELRTEAAMAMVEMDRSDVDGVTLLRKSLDDLQTEDPRAGQAIVTGMIPRLKALLATEPEPESGGLDPVQVRAKDAAYMVIPYARTEDRDPLVRSVVGWYSVDFEGRSLAGDYSAEQVTRALGAEAAEMLVDTLDEKMTPQAMIKIAEIIAEDGNEATKKRAADRLIEIERRMEKPAFVSWLGEQIRASVKASGEELDPQRIDALALYNRENYVNQGALAAMHHLGGQEAVATRLLRIADTKPGPNDPEAWVERLSTRRATALKALEGHVGRVHLNRLLAIALDPSNPIEVRDYAFDRVGDIQSADAIPRLWPLVERVGCGGGTCAAAQKLDKRLRWRAGELVLSLSGPSMISPFSQRLPAVPGIEYEPEELEGYATRMSQMTPPPTSAVLGLLDSQQWWNRVVALRYLERRGGEADIPAMKRLVSDETQVSGQGWSELNPPVKTVGQVAQAAIEALRTREQSEQRGE